MFIFENPRKWDCNQSACCAVFDFELSEPELCVLRDAARVVQPLASCDTH